MRLFGNVYKLSLLAHNQHSCHQGKFAEKIGEVYHINNQRIKEFDQKLSLPEQSALFNEKHAKLVEKMKEMEESRDAFIQTYKSDKLDSKLLSKVKFNILTSLKNHWDGLSVFIEHPGVPMDNNPGERSIRNPIPGRKNFYGSGRLWSSQLAAIMFSIFQTIYLCGLNCNHWLRSYLTACAENHGKVPDNLFSFLPWEMSEKRRHELSKRPNTP